MEELIRQVTERTGISEEQARTAVQTVFGYLQNNLPAGISQQLGGLLGGGGAAGGGGGAGRASAASATSGVPSFRQKFFASS